MKSPICWNGFVFVHTRSDDNYDYYSGDGTPGRLAHSRTGNLWMACLRDAKAFYHGDESRDDKAAARAALDAALEVLRRRVAADRDWIKHVEREIG